MNYNGENDTYLYKLKVPEKGRIWIQNILNILS